MAPARAQALAAFTDPVVHAEALVPKLEVLSARMEHERRVLPEVLDALHAAGLFRLTLPRSQNGAETDPLTLLRVIETLARGDASTVCPRSPSTRLSSLAWRWASRVGRWTPSWRSRATRCRGA
nr:acyl-CoA dehydrogenase family protein [Archangium sp.]